MSDWPPKPEQSSSTPTPRTPNGPEWQLLENVLMASVAEQRRSRRWGIFFKLLTLGYVVMVFVTLSRGCSSDDAMGTGHSEPHLAVIDIDGEIGGSRGVASDDIIQSLDDAFDAKQSRAIVLNINSPGGSPVQSDEIWQEIRRLRALPCRRLKGGLRGLSVRSARARGCPRRGRGCGRGSRRRRAARAAAARAGCRRA